MQPEVEWLTPCFRWETYSTHNRRHAVRKDSVVSMSLQYYYLLLEAFLTTDAFNNSNTCPLQVHRWLWGLQNWTFPFFSQWFYTWVRLTFLSGINSPWFLALCYGTSFRLVGQGISTCTFVQLHCLPSYLSRVWFARWCWRELMLLRPCLFVPIVTSCLDHSFIVSFPAFSTFCSHSLFTVVCPGNSTRRRWHLSRKPYMTF